MVSLADILGLSHNQRNKCFLKDWKRKKYSWKYKSYKNTDACIVNKNENWVHFICAVALDAAVFFAVLKSNLLVAGRGISDNWEKNMLLPVRMLRCLIQTFSQVFFEISTEITSNIWVGGWNSTV